MASLPILPFSQNQQIGKGVRFPTICCRCGIQPGTIPLKICSVQSRAHHLLITTIIEQINRTLSVLVCESCKKTLRYVRLKNTMIAIGAVIFSFVLGLVGGYFGSAWAGDGQWFTWSLLGVPLSILFVGMPLGFFLSDHLGLVLGTFDGNLFWFANPIYHQQFRSLNPSLAANEPKRTRDAVLSWR